MLTASHPGSMPAAMVLALKLGVLQYEGYCALILCGFIVLAHLITALCLTKLNFLKR